MAANPCGACIDRPCVSACICGALTDDGYDAACCIKRLQSTAGITCLKNGCRARHACPVGRDYAYGRAQAEFHMRAFVETFGPLILNT